MKRKEYAEIKGSLDVFIESMDYLLYPGRQNHYTGKDMRLLKELEVKLAEVQDHFWIKSLSKKERKEIGLGKA